ncbi:MAG: hypothetical protein A2161_16545 [Candidatus Schekmanbacteria bacterium RBG_13_48_7]|uniref:Metallopeptidase family protein n=1 Tax=Candidatus Schekmanbacteria bacterium RBG_13_48_7 TaxID=1817878 RepID=A0A1F7RYZ0_9BACT|nr:MAG: hypothetical protein A2161_16545 [Candidatus Schekmanbacteria bacterium RBG_13_48_7]
MDRNTFEEYVRKAVEELPDTFREKIDNVEIVVENSPSPSIMKTMGLNKNSLLLGLYQGVPITKRSSHYGLVLPDKITIFQAPIEYLYKTEKAIITAIRDTIVHEIAHYFGIDDDRLREIEREKRKKR